MHNSRLLLGCIVIVALVAISSTAFAQRSRLKARLEGDGGRGSVAVATKEDGNGRLVVRVRSRDVGSATALVTVCGVQVGTITLEPRRQGNVSGGRLKVSSRNGGTIPSCAAGDAVSVSGSGIALSGTLGSRSPGR